METIIAITIIFFWMYRYLTQYEECNNCYGRGYVNYTCCGDDIADEDYKMCPTCGEHCGDENEDCEECNGKCLTKKNRKWYQIN